MEPPMDIFFSPLACSMASRIVVYEAGGTANFVRVDTRAGRTADGQDYSKINRKGLVPAIRTDEGEVLTENAAVLQYLGGLYPDRDLAPEGFDGALLRQWLSFIGTELHTGTFHPLFSRTGGDEVKAYAREEAVKRLSYLNDHLEGREWLLDRFTVADAYLTVVLNWAGFVNLDLAPYPHVAAYLERAKSRPSIARAMGEEMALFQAA
jgi:glutathione S-transferase